MKQKPFVSIIINNYNYDRFLAEAIDSALNQTYPNTEVIVVDDGSTDGSRDIISGYGSQIIPVLKSNGGQASSLNEGFEASQGEIICFLDSDDLFHDNKVEKVVDLLNREHLLNASVVFHNSFRAIDSQGCLMEEEIDIANDMFRAKGSESIYPEVRHLFKLCGTNSFFDSEMNKVCESEQIYQFASRYRFIPFIGMPTSSISVSRVMAEKLFPLPTSGPKIAADELIVKAASLIGSVYSTSLVMTQYRLHGNNGWYGQKSTQEIEEGCAVRRDKYLNLKLQEIGKRPVFSFLASMQAEGFYRYYFGRNAGNQLVALAFQVLKWYIDLTTIRFFAQTFTRGTYYKLFSLTHRVLKKS